MAPNLQQDADTVVQPLDTVDIPITLSNRRLLVRELPFLWDMPSNVVVTPFSEICASKVADPTGCFLGFDAGASKSRHVVPLGTLKDTRFMSIFRFKMWWSTHWVGERGSDLETETQLLLLDTPRKAASLNMGAHPYVLVLPLIEGKFRASLQPGADDTVAVCVESGSNAVEASSFRSCVYIHAGWNPYDLLRDAMRAVRSHLGTFRLLEEKTPPGIIDKFGWCTWDAFYLTVHPEGVWEGVKRLAEGGCPPGLLIIDDGWQSISHDDDPSREAMGLTVAGEQMPCRLTRFRENFKFGNYVQGSLRRNPEEAAGAEIEAPGVGMGAFVRDLKAEHENLEYVYVWHAFCGYWGGLRPGSTELPAKVVAPVLSPGLQNTMEDLAVDKLVNHGIGLVPPDRAGDLYEALHSYLANAGIDGVKVDVIHVLETICDDFGGRVELAKAYFRALSASVRKHFNGNGVIASMEHCNDFMYLGTEQISAGRVGDDFWVTDKSGDPNGSFWLQGCHMVHCAYNSLWMGQVIHPDWDMFQSTHPCAAFHAASRAISGGPVYVSDTVDSHDFALLKKLVVPDGSILRCSRYALPTRDCLFEDPLQDGATMLKIWNLNKCGGVVGAFNCQGGGWSREERRNKSASEFSKRVYSTVSPRDVEWESDRIPEAVAEFSVYLHEARALTVVKGTDEIHVSLDPFKFEIITMAPVLQILLGVKFSAVGLGNMLNTGGAIQSVRVDPQAVSAEVEIRGCGEMWAYASEPPNLCTLNGRDVDFVYNPEDGTVVVQIPWTGGTHSILRYFF